MDHGNARSTARVSALQRALEERVTNPCLRTILRSRLHWPASSWLTLVSYEGVKTGRRYTFPVLYQRRGASVVAVTPSGETTWWRNFSRPHRCTLWLGGRARAAVGELATGEERDRLLADYLDSYGFVRRLFDAGGEPDGAGRGDEGIAADLAVVRFDLTG